MQQQWQASAWGVSAGGSWWCSCSSFLPWLEPWAVCSLEVFGRRVLLNLNYLAKRSHKREGLYVEIFLLNVTPEWRCGSNIGNFALQCVTVSTILGTLTWLSIPAECILIPTFWFPWKSLNLSSWNKYRCLLSFFVSAASAGNLHHMFITLQLKQFCLTASLFSPTCFIWNVCSLLWHHFASFHPLLFQPSLIELTLITPFNDLKIHF